MGLKQHFTRNEDYFMTSSENKSIEIEGSEDNRIKIT